MTVFIKMRIVKWRLCMCVYVYIYVYRSVFFFVFFFQKPYLALQKLQFPLVLEPECYYRCGICFRITQKP